MQAKLTLSLTFKYIISYKIRKVLPSNHGRTDKQVHISQNTFILLILLSLYEALNGMISIVPGGVVVDEKYKTDLVTTFLSWCIKKDTRAVLKHRTINYQSKQMNKNVSPKEMQF